RSRPTRADQPGLRHADARAAAGPGRRPRRVAPGRNGLVHDGELLHERVRGAHERGQGAAARGEGKVRGVDVPDGGRRVHRPPRPVDAQPVNTQDIYRRAVEEFGRRMDAVRDDQWGNTTPCTDWNVRALVNHVVSEDRWVVPLLAGRTIDEVGSSLDGDLLGDDPKASWKQTHSDALDAVAGDG